MAWQRGDIHRPLKNAADQRSAVTRSYVKNVTVKFEEKLGETTSSSLQVQKSRNVRISFRLKDGSNAELPSRSVTRNTDRTMLKCAVNTVDLTGDRKDKTCTLPAVRHVCIESGRRCSDPLITCPTHSSDAEKRVSPGVTSTVDAQKCQSATDFQLAVGTESSGACRCHPATVNRCVATLDLAMNNSVHVENSSANYRAPSVGCGS